MFHSKTDSLWLWHINITKVSADQRYNLLKVIVISSMKIDVRIYNNLFISKAPNHDTNYDSGYNEEFFTLIF